MTCDSAFLFRVAQVQEDVVGVPPLRVQDALLLLHKGLHVLLCVHSGGGFPQEEANLQIFRVSFVVGVRRLHQRKVTYADIHQPTRQKSKCLYFEQVTIIMLNMQLMNETTSAAYEN